MDGLDEEQQNEHADYLANFLTYDKKSDQNLENTEQWPVSKLVIRANEVINRIKAYRVIRQMTTESNSNNSPRAPSLQGSTSGKLADNQTPLRQERRQFFS
uniref:Uncharacterized protein n=1 Tax=Meloidogyne javanica TaxID=6303 RepID=A0A915MK34_MELJA